MSGDVRRVVTLLFDMETVEKQIKELEEKRKRGGLSEADVKTLEDMKQTRNKVRKELEDQNDTNYRIRVGMMKVKEQEAKLKEMKRDEFEMEKIWLPGRGSDSVASIKAEFGFDEEVELKADEKGWWFKAFPNEVEDLKKKGWETEGTIVKAETVKVIMKVPNTYKWEEKKDEIWPNEIHKRIGKIRKVTELQAENKVLIALEVGPVEDIAQCKEAQVIAQKAAFPLKDIGEVEAMIEGKKELMLKVEYQFGEELEPRQVKKWLLAQKTKPLLVMKRRNDKGIMKGMLVALMADSKSVDAMVARKNESIGRVSVTFSRI